MTNSHCSSHSCHKKDDCSSGVGYGDVLRLQTVADLCCALGLIESLEGVLAGEMPDATNPDLNVTMHAQNLRDFLVEHPWTLPVLDGANNKVGDTSFDPNDIQTYGAWRYLDCICKKVPFLWKECVVNAEVGGDDVRSVKVSIFDLAKEEPEYAYGNNGTAPSDFLQAVCCLKRHYQQLKAVLEH